MVQDEIHKKIVQNCTAVETWFKEVRAGVDVPFYSSYDIRDFGHKVTNVDANIYPAGFNNICPTDRDHCDELVKEYIERHYGEAKRVLILTEEHTSNPFYWDNVAVLLKLITTAGFEARIAFPRMRTGEKMTLQSASYGEIIADAAVIQNGRISVAGFEPDVVISNNDFSEAYE
ncbi:MAG TPA: glutamate--cysteine ligase, partial [Bdellovibrionales bacterium]|nr:glutamate--cysteine ligase [Bdellovibrionales bacterium]